MTLNVALVCPPSGKYKMQSDISMARELGFVNKGQYLHPPIGVAYVAALLQKEGHKCIIIDAVAEDMDKTAVMERLKEFNPDVVLVQLVTPLFRDSMAQLREYKKQGWIAGVAGPHATVFPDSCLDEGADFVIRKEPEYTMRDLASVIEKKTSWDSVLGISWIKNNKKIHNKERPLIANLDDLPFPARELLPWKKYKIPFGKDSAYTVILTSRGCPYNCIFCGTHIYYGRTLRLRSGKNVVDEIEEIVNKFGINHFSLWDDTFTVNKQHVMDVCNEIIRRGLKVKWYCLGRADNVDEEALAIMKKAGCYQIQYGFESGSEQVLKYMRKGITPEQIRNAVRLTAKAGIEVSALFVIGFPEETEEDIEKTIEIAKTPGIKWAQFNIATPYPGTDMYDMVKGDLKESWEAFDSYNVLDMKRKVDKKRLMKLMRKAHREFYFRPSRILMEMKDLSPKSLSNKLWTLKQFLKLYVMPQKKEC